MAAWLLALTFLGAMQLETMHSHGTHSGIESSLDCQLCSTGSLVSAISSAAPVWASLIIFTPAILALVPPNKTVISRNYLSRAPPLTSK